MEIKIKNVKEQLGLPNHQIWTQLYKVIDTHLSISITFLYSLFLFIFLSFYVKFIYIAYWTSGGACGIMEAVMVLWGYLWCNGGGQYLIEVFME